MKGQLVKDDSGKINLNFGKYKGRPLDEIVTTDMGYITWMINSEKTPRDTKTSLRVSLKK